MRPLLRQGKPEYPMQDREDNHDINRWPLLSLLLRQFPKESHFDFSTGFDIRNEP